jgi:phosphatidylserine/phosphatidylglycerophosphate/cardiolipin synthase-like enzyme
LDRKKLTKLLVLYEEINRYIDSRESNRIDTHLINKVKKLFPNLSPLEIENLLCLLRMERAMHKRQEHKVEIVGTFPSNLDIDIRHTVSVVRQLILEAEKSILITGYSISEFVNEIFEILINRSREGLKVEFFIDKAINPNDFFNIDTKNANFRIYQYRSNQRFSSLHSKVIISDNRSAFVSSSNLSYNGIVNNIEIGTLISGEKVNSIVNLFKILLLEDMFIELT